MSAVALIARMPTALHAAQRPAAARLLSLRGGAAPAPQFAAALFDFDGTRAPLSPEGARMPR